MLNITNIAEVQNFEVISDAYQVDKIMISKMAEAFKGKQMVSCVYHSKFYNPLTCPVFEAWNALK